MKIRIFLHNSLGRKSLKDIDSRRKNSFSLMIINLMVALIFLSPDEAAFSSFTHPAEAQAQKLTGEEILRRVDDNITADNKIMVAKMIIHLRRTSRTVEFKSYVQGTQKAFTEYLAPPREKGTKMLKLGDQLWMYSPWTERTILISGHMLRQSVMGSDLSYEDMMEDPRLENSYVAELVGEEKIALEALGEISCWVLELKARSEDVAYPARRLWVDKERFVGLREERYAKGGTLLKKTEVLGLRKFGPRWVPARAVFKDMLRAGEGTEFIIDSIEFDAKIPDYIFTRAALK